MPVGNTSGVQIPQRSSGRDALYQGGRAHTEAYLYADGDKVGGSLDFVAQTIIVDNWSSLYVYLPELKRWAAPNATQQVFPTGGVSTQSIRFAAPSGLTQGSDNGAPVTVTWLEQAVLYAAPTR